MFSEWANMILLMTLMLILMCHAVQKSRYNAAAASLKCSVMISQGMISQGEFSDQGGN